MLIIFSFSGWVPSPVAQTQDTENYNDINVQSYPKPYFDLYSPQTALDMIDRLPGFRIDAGEELRGFGSGAGNVLIDGARPLSKLGGVKDALERVNASSVSRIDVIRGSAGSSEAAGQSYVANVITTDVSGDKSRWEFQTEHADHGKINTAGEIVMSQMLRGWNISTKLGGFTERRPLDGTRVSRNASGAVTFVELESSPSDLRELELSSKFGRTVASGTLNMNLQFSDTDFSNDTSRLGFSEPVLNRTPDQRRRIKHTSSRTNGEFAIDWGQRLSESSSIKLVSLSSMEHFTSQSLTFLERPIDVDVLNSDFDNRQDVFETVFRGTLKRKGQHRLHHELGGELAYNRLDSNLALREESVTGIFDIAIPAANVFVEELRGELFSNFIWKAFKDFTIETGVGVELSEISVSGDAENTQSFFFFKPSVTFVYDVTPDAQFSFGARRSVGQLEFSDFAASASASDDRITAGNPDLGPDQTTRAWSSVDLRSKRHGALNIEFFHEWRDDILEQILLPSGAQGLGNAGSARVWGVKSTTTTPLDVIIPGGLIETEVELRDSSFSDPIILKKRSVSSIDKADILLEFRQDLTPLQVSWGISYRAPLSGPFYFTDEISLNRDGQLWSAFIETTRWFGFKTNLELFGIGEQNFSRRRSFFTPDRSGTFLGSQLISRDRGKFATLTLSRQF